VRLRSPVRAPPHPHFPPRAVRRRPASQWLRPPAVSRPSRESTLVRSKPTSRRGGAAQGVLRVLPRAWRFCTSGRVVLPLCLSLQQQHSTRLRLSLSDAWRWPRIMTRRSRPPSLRHYPIARHSLMACWLRNTAARREVLPGGQRQCICIVRQQAQDPREAQEQASACLREAADATKICCAKYSAQQAPCSFAHATGHGSHEESANAAWSDAAFEPAHAALRKRAGWTCGRPVLEPRRL